ncbi:asparagine synthetase B family protein [Photorhabdus luminescens]|uniref:asparagine synthetase B family protein n=1 Tax=Photorhabdus luminescens TaxID=29488 RepID=UPI002240BAAD|nr:asparagine synthetase B [Photorhabdus luminescens]MCW7762563.1 asparagine synthetase B [Photorhabdus luminescens subsp. venezuelensis]
MCGIAAVSIESGVSRSPSSILHAINKRQYLLGLDGSSIAISGSNGIGIVRFHIRTEQPEIEPILLDSQRIAAYNGEIYWHKGEVPSREKGEILALVSQGSEQVDGMYALAVLNRDDSTITLARDKFGIKPLWYRILDDAVIAASHPGALVGIKNVSLRYEAIYQFLTYGRPIDGQGFLNGILPVPPRSSLTFSNGRILTKITSTNSLCCPYPYQPKPEELREAVRESLEKVLPLQRNIGLAVSGGLDSTILAHEIAARGIENLRTVSVKVIGGKDGIENLDQLNIKHPVVQGWSHNCLTVTPKMFAEAIRRVPFELGVPCALSSAPLYISLAEVAKEVGIEVLVLGEGADELFMGYTSYSQINTTDSNSFYRFMVPAVKEPYLRALIGTENLKDMQDLLEVIYPTFKNMSLLQRIREAEIDHSLEPLLQRADQILMARSIEGRVPFLHGDVPNIAFSISPEEHIKNGIGKSFLRSAFPELDIKKSPWQTKYPFRAPINDWLCGPLRNWADELLRLNSQKLQEMGLHLDGINLVRRGLAKRESAAATIAMSLLSLVFWSEYLEYEGRFS